jgi:macrolide transport system ATP-binding/permease protein
MSLRTLAATTSFLRAWLLRSRMEHDMDREMRFHLEARAADLQSQGVARADAERRARQEFGDVVRWKEAGREAHGLSFVDDLAGDLRYAWRAMRRSPGFAAAAVISLALGIGASTSIFGLLDLLLLRPVPVRDPYELVHITTSGERGDAHSGSSNSPWFREVASRTDLFADAMLIRHDVYKVVIRGRLEPLTGQRVTTNYHSLLGIRAFLGRTFTAGDRPEIGAPPVAVISHSLWQRRFGGSADVIGTSINVDQLSYTIVGVTPPEFHGILIGWTTDVAMPLDTSEFMQPGNWSTMPLLARLRPGVEIEHTRQQLEPMLARFVAAGTTSERFRARYLQRVSVTSAATGITDLRTQFSTPLRLLTVAVGLLLLITCVNLAGLLLARNATRQHELGMRLALGAGRWRVVRQLLTESSALALAGAALGVALAIQGGNVLVGLMPQHFGPVSARLVPDGRLLGFAVLATVVTTLLFGLMPAWHASRLAALPGVNPRTTTTRLRMGRLLVVAQFALSLVLVAGAMLCLRTVGNLEQVDTGFDRDRLLVVRMDPQGTGYERERLRAFQREMLETLGSLPGVQHVTLTTGSPFNGNVDGRRLTIPGIEPREPDDTIIQVNLIGPGYFDALRATILRGRAIDERDREGTQRVAVVSEGFAHRYFGDAAAAIGRSFIVNRGPTPIRHEIVGVAKDLRYQDLRRPSERLAYLPWFQADDVTLAPFEFVLRTDGDPVKWIDLTRSAIQQRRSDAPILAIQTMTAVINGRLLSERLLAMLGTFFAIVALTLAAVGVYGLFAHLVARRTPEIGVRLALGARPIEIVWMTIRENLLLVATGAVVGIVSAAEGLRLLDGLLFGLSSTDTVTLVVAALVLVFVSLAAALVPATRAATVDPLVALRAE